MSLLVISLLILVGLVLLVLEILVLPGFIAGLLGGVMMVSGIWGAYKYHGLLYGNITLGITLAVSVLSILMMLKSKTWNKMTLHTSIDGRINDHMDDVVKVGDEGVTVSRLAPMGKAQFGDLYCEVQAKDGWIDPGKEVEVYKIIDKKIIVKLKK